MTSRARDVARGLSRYLCGTHSGLLALRVSRLRPSRAYSAGELVRAHRTLEAPSVETTSFPIGERVWEPQGASSLVRALKVLSSHPSVIDLVLFGSQASGRTTGFSDVDAILVIRDEAMDEPDAIRRLRRRVLAAQRAVLAHQPMQHHGFEVVTPRLLCDASSALGLPTAALTETRSLLATPIVAHVRPDRAREAAAALRAMAQAVGEYRAWPRHAWDVHRAIAMFELLPALYLQSRGTAVTKAESFAKARDHFEDWWPYDVLDDVRTAWPRTRRHSLELTAASVRNPWLALAIWRRAHVPVPKPVRPLLTPQLLDALQALAKSMAAASAGGQ